MLTKQKVQQLVEKMPDQFSIDDLIDKITLLQKIEQAQQEIKNGEFYSWDDVKKEMDSWSE